MYDNRSIPFVASDGNKYEIRQTSFGETVQLRAFRGNIPAGPGFGTDRSTADAFWDRNGENVIDRFIEIVKSDIERHIGSN
jgi:hypothetical protein